VYGGVPKPPQVKTLKAGVEVVVGTPGRMEDLMNDGVLKLQASCRAAVAGMCCVCLFLMRAAGRQRVPGEGGACLSM
jgi:hypothetical protein